MFITETFKERKNERKKKKKYIENCLSLKIMNVGKSTPDYFVLRTLVLAKIKSC